MDKLNIALIAHDEKKTLMSLFCKINESTLAKHELYATGTTGQDIMDRTNLNITRLLSGPMGGDAELGALVSRQKIDLVIFLRDPLTAQPHESDIQALIRLCDVHNIPIATNIASAKVFIKCLNVNMQNL